MKKPLEVGKKCWVVNNNDIKEGTFNKLDDVGYAHIRVAYSHIVISYHTHVFATPTEAAEYLIEKSKPKAPEAKPAPDPAPYKIGEHVFFVSDGIVREGNVVTVSECEIAIVVYISNISCSRSKLPKSRVARTYTEATAILNRMTKITNSLGQVLWLLPGDRVWCVFNKSAIAGQYTKVTLGYADVTMTNGYDMICNDGNIYLTKHDAQRAMLVDKTGVNDKVKGCFEAIFNDWKLILLENRHEMLNGKPGDYDPSHKRGEPLLKPKQSGIPENKDPMPTPPKVGMYIDGVLMGEMEGKPAGSMGDVYSNVPPTDTRKFSQREHEPRLQILEKKVAELIECLDDEEKERIKDEKTINENFSGLFDMLTTINTKVSENEADLRKQISELQKLVYNQDGCNMVICQRLDGQDKRIENVASNVKDLDKRQTVLGEAYDSFVKHFSSVLSRLDELEKPKTNKK